MSMSLLKSTLIAALLLTGSIAFAEPPSDVAGWETLDWGASVEDLTAHLGRFPSGKASAPHCDELYGEPAVEHLGLKFELAMFCFRGQRLVEVDLLIRNGSGGNWSSHREVRARLEDVYGSPELLPEGWSPSPHDADGLDVDTWQFKSTRIMLDSGFDVILIYVSTVKADVGEER